MITFSSLRKAGVSISRSLCLVRNGKRSIGTVHFTRVDSYAEEKRHSFNSLSSFLKETDQYLFELSKGSDAWSVISSVDSPVFTKLMSSALKKNSHLVDQLLECASASNVKKLESGDEAASLLKLSKEVSKAVVKFIRSNKVSFIIVA